MPVFFISCPLLLFCDLRLSPSIAGICQSLVRKLPFAPLCQILQCCKAWITDSTDLYFYPFDWLLLFVYALSDVCLIMQSGNCWFGRGGDAVPRNCAEAETEYFTAAGDTQLRICWFNYSLAARKSCSKSFWKIAWSRCLLFAIITQIIFMYYFLAFFVDIFAAPVWSISFFFNNNSARLYFWFHLLCAESVFTFLNFVLCLMLSDRLSQNSTTNLPALLYLNLRSSVSALEALAGSGKFCCVCNRMAF